MTTNVVTEIIPHIYQAHDIPSIIDNYLLNVPKSIREDSQFLNFCNELTYFRSLILDEQKVNHPKDLDDLYEAIVVRDVMLRHGIREQTALRNVLAFLLDNIGNPFSARNISGRMVSEGMKISTATVLNYVDYFKEAFILLNASRYDIKGKALLSSTEKYYAVDLGLRNVIKKSEKLDSNKLYENIVYLEMRSRGYEVQVGKLDDTEIDFICYRGNEKLYIQVAYLITPANEEREFGNLERLNDNYPKYVISSDLVDLSRNGIIHRNIIHFLLNP